MTCTSAAHWVGEEILICTAASHLVGPDPARFTPAAPLVGPEPLRFTTVAHLRGSDFLICHLAAHLVGADSPTHLPFFIEGVSSRFNKLSSRLRSASFATAVTPSRLRLSRFDTPSGIENACS